MSEESIAGMIERTPVPKARLDIQGRITVPKTVRQRLGLRPGDQILFVEDHGTFRLEKLVAVSPFAQYRGFLTHLAGQDPDQLVKEMRGG